MELRRQGVEEGLELGGEEADGDQVGELGEEATEDDEGGEGVASAGLEGLNDQAYLEREVVGLFDDLPGEVFDVGQGEGLGVVAVFEGVEVAGGCASAPGAELVVAMGTAVGMATHGPGAAAWDVARVFVQVSGHGCL